MIITGENFVLIGALLLFVAVMAGKVAYRFGAPALLLFLGVGMLFGLNFISFRSVEMTQFIGMISLCIILFTGGMDTSFEEIRPVLGPGIVLATVGVVLTAAVLAGFVWLVAPWMGFEMSFPMALLLASTISSTDSASVFSILRSKKQGLKQHLRPHALFRQRQQRGVKLPQKIVLAEIHTQRDAPEMFHGRTAHHADHFRRKTRRQAVNGKVSQIFKNAQSNALARAGKPRHNADRRVFFTGGRIGGRFHAHESFPG